MVGLTIAVLGLLAAVCLLMGKLYIKNRQLEKMKKGNIEKDRYLVSMSHEIRTPLNGIIGMQFLMRQNMNNPDKLETYLDKLEMSSEYLKTLVTDVLDMSKIESGQMELLEEPVDLRKLLREVQVLIQIQADKEGLEFAADIRLEEPVIIGDSVRIKQILINLLGNAVKFTDTGGTVSLTVRQRKAESNRTETVFTIKDNGRGMSREFLKKIWEPFEQEEGSTRRGGSGLGTTLSKSLTKQMHGHITVESIAGEGTAFTVSIPAETGKSSDVRTKARHQEAGAGISSGRILVAEDNEINREIVCEVLKTRGYETLESTDGEETVRMFRESGQGEIRVILMDIQMPRVDGYEAARQIRAMERPDAAGVKIIALTANAFKEQLEQARAAGMDDAVTKPLDVEQLLRLLEA